MNDKYMFDGWGVVDGDLHMFGAGGVTEPVVDEWPVDQAVYYRSARDMWTDLESAKYAALRETKTALEDALQAVTEALYEFPAGFEPRPVPAVLVSLWRAVLPREEQW